MTSFRFCLAVMASVCLLVAGAACTGADVSEGPTPPAANDDNESDFEPECRVDSECEYYFRCMDQVCAAPPAMTGERDETTPVARFFDEEGQKLARFYLELALTSEEQSRGLMYRTQMLDEWGMLFVYEEDRHLSFWMKNTLIPLDMIFVNSAKEVVGVIHEAQPEDETPRGVGIPSRYVVEINGGLAREFGIDSGATMSLEYVDQNTGTQR